MVHCKKKQKKQTSICSRFGGDGSQIFLLCDIRNASTRALVKSHVQSSRTFEKLIINPTGTCHEGSPKPVAHSVVMNLS